VSGNGYHGALYGDSGLLAPVWGTDSLQLGSSSRNDYILLPTALCSALSVRSSFTVIYTLTYVTMDNGYHFSFGQSSGSKNFGAYYSTTLPGPSVFY
jgi:hypothetical protein